MEYASFSMKPKGFIHVSLDNRYIEHTHHVQTFICLVVFENRILNKLMIILTLSLSKLWCLGVYPSPHVQARVSTEEIDWLITTRFE